MKDAKKLLEGLVGPMTVGTLFSAYRARHELSQPQFAELIGVSKSFVSDIENNRKFMSIEKLKRICKILKQNERYWVSVYFTQEIREAGYSLEELVKAKAS